MTPLDAVRRPDVGFYGKLPTHGDFLRRRVSDAFVEVWDAWLQSCIAVSRDALEDRWLDAYLTSPAWRFVCAAGACCPNPVAGIIVPSVDRVGRYFPLTVVVELQPSTSLVSLPQEAGEFFDNAERLIVDALSAQEPDFEAFDASVARLTDYLPLTPPSQEVILEGAAGAILDGGPDARWQFPIGSASRVSVALQQLLERKLTQTYQPFVMWWTEGSSLVEPSCIIQQGLPAPESFAALLDGSWADRQWRSASAQLDVAEEPELLLDAATPRQFRSAAMSDVGKVRKINQDSFIERSEVGIWAVADGVGGHSHGEVASRMVCDALADITPQSRFSDVIAAARDRLIGVNEYLFRQGADDDSRRSGSTVVVLLTRGSRYAVLWAGDSRMYLLRDGHLSQITRDHSAKEIDENGVEHDAHGITRAIGGDAALSLDEIQDRLQVGDRFLLCSDGLTREVSDDQIRAQLGNGDVRAAADALVKSALGSNGRDNVTALIVEAGA